MHACMALAEHMKKFPMSLEHGMLDFSLIVYQSVDVWQKFIIQPIPLKNNYVTNKCYGYN